MKIPGQIRILACLVMLSFMLVSGRATAYDPSIFNSLSRSKDALMAQRAHLQDAADDAKAKIDVLQRQLDTINAYLTDTDSALNDVQSALARAQ